MGKAVVRYGAILASAAMFALYARVELPWALLAWVALIPWLASLEQEHSTIAAVWSGVVMSMAFTLAVFAWFGSAVARYTHSSPLVTFPLLLLAAPGLQPQIVVFATMRHWLSSRGRSRAFVAVAAACAWMGTEWLCPHLFGDTLGHGLLPFARLRQGADIAGAAGLTFVILLVNESLYAALRELRQAPRRALLAALPAVVLVAALAGYGSVRLRELMSAVPRRAPLEAALVQANLGDYEGLRARVGSFEAVRTILDIHEKRSRTALADAAQSLGSAQPVELLVWPETVYPTTFGNPKSPAGASFDADIVDFVSRIDVPLLFGTYDRSGDREFNAAVLLQPNADGTTRRTVYRKRHLFPLTEEVPAWLDSAVVRRELPWLGTWHAGDGPQLLALERRNGTTLHIAPLICLDAVDPDLAIDAARGGADLIVTLSNDGWFANTPGARLHLAVSAFRSIETRLPQLRATNTGISAIIDATGQILARSPSGKPATLTGTVVPGRAGETLALQWGEWLGPSGALVALVLSALALLRRSPART